MFGGIIMNIGITPQWMREIGYISPQSYTQGTSSKTENDSISFVAATPVNPKFYADTGHWYLSKGISAINGICVIQKSLLNELHQEEQKEFLLHV